MKINDSSERGIFTTGTSISESNAWFISLIRQFREFLNERRNPTPRAEITAQSDPSALDKLVNPPSQIVSLFSTVRAIIHDKLHPHKLEMTATPVEVEELWAKPQNHIPGLLSLLAHVSVVTAFIVISVMSYNKAKTVVKNTVLMDPITLSLPPAPVKSGGGGGGGTKAPTPASKGVLPKAADKQFVPPTPKVTLVDPYLAAIPTIVAPQLSNLLTVTDLLHTGLPTGVIGPPSAGPGTGGGIGDGDGRGVGPGKGAGLGPGEGGGTGGDIYRGGGGPGVIAPACSYTPEPNYSDDARKAHVQGDVVLSTIVQTDGKIDVSKVVQSLGYGLDDEAKKVLKLWKCSPGKIDGKIQAFQLQVKISFHLY